MFGIGETELAITPALFVFLVFGPDKLLARAARLAVLSDSSRTPPQRLIVVRAWILQRMHFTRNPKRLSSLQNAALDADRE